MSLFIRLIIILILAFFTMLAIDKAICSRKFNLWYTKRCKKALQAISEEQYERIMQWLRLNIESSLDSEMSAKEIISHIPVELRYKINERRIIACMADLGYDYLSDCFLDPACYAVILKKEGSIK